MAFATPGEGGLVSQLRMVRWASYGVQQPRTGTLGQAGSRGPALCPGFCPSGAAAPAGLCLHGAPGRQGGVADRTGTRTRDSSWGWCSEGGWCLPNNVLEHSTAGPSWGESGTWCPGMSGPWGWGGTRWPIWSKGQVWQLPNTQHKLLLLARSAPVSALLRLHCQSSPTSPAAIGQGAQPSASAARNPGPGVTRLLPGRMSRVSGDHRRASALAAAASVSLSGHGNSSEGQTRRHGCRCSARDEVGGQAHGAAGLNPTVPRQWGP